MTCTPHYGYGMKICEVIQLPETYYEENDIHTIKPDWAKRLVSTHTINAAKKLMVVDALVKRRR